MNPTGKSRSGGAGGGRLAVRKTWKLFIGGAFPRTESGRTERIALADGSSVHVSRASRKDLRNAVEVARKAQPGWAARTAYLRGQILYRIAEMLEARREEFISTLSGSRAVSSAAAAREVDASVDRLVHFAGWADKLGAVLGTVNPVAAPFFSFSMPEPTGVVGLVAPDQPSLLGTISMIAPVIVSGNTVVVVVSRSHPLAPLDFAEVLATSDVPGGVVNLLSGRLEELVPWMAGHRDVDAIDEASGEAKWRKAVELGSASNLKRVAPRPLLREEDWFDERRMHALSAIEPFVETKTTWHPVGC